MPIVIIHTPNFRWWLFIITLGWLNFQPSFHFNSIRFRKKNNIKNDENALVFRFHFSFRNSFRITDNRHVCMYFFAGSKHKYTLKYCLVHLCVRLCYLISLLFKILCVYLCFSMFFSFIVVLFYPFFSQLVVYFVGIRGTTTAVAAVNGSSRQYIYHLIILCKLRVAVGDFFLLFVSYLKLFCLLVVDVLLTVIVWK